MGRVFEILSNEQRKQPPEISLHLIPLIRAFDRDISGIEWGFPFPSHFLTPDDEEFLGLKRLITVFMIGQRRAISTRRLAERHNVHDVGKGGEREVTRIKGVVPPPKDMSSRDPQLRLIQAYNDEMELQCYLSARRVILLRACFNWSKTLRQAVADRSFNICYDEVTNRVPSCRGISAKLTQVNRGICPGCETLGMNMVLMTSPGEIPHGLQHSTRESPNESNLFQSVEDFAAPSNWGGGREGIAHQHPPSALKLLAGYGLDNISLLLLVFLHANATLQSAMANFNKRMAIRHSWGFEKRFSDVPIRTVFVLGVHESNKKLQFMVQDEQRKFDDVKLFAGFVFVSAPHRHRSSKWYVRLSEYPYHMWPPYVTAGAYILSHDALVDMYYGSLYTQHFRFDDIYLGLVAKKVDLEPFHCPEFYFYKKEYNVYSYRYVIASHGFSDPDELLRIWNEQRSAGNA
uniref:Hexosyltransferase n=1 Tax=Timema californicum TaxID=61474 RepID=A0A7R9J7G0_TIMCA|nr:unnamed protein product [Timema californicum]